MKSLKPPTEKQKLWQYRVMLENENKLAQKEMERASKIARMVRKHKKK